MKETASYVPYVLYRRARSNPPSVFATFRYAAYLNLRRDVGVLFGLALRGSAFSCPYPENLQLTPSPYPRGLVSVPLPAVSNYSSPSRAPRQEGGVSSAVAVFRALARQIRYRIWVFGCFYDLYLYIKCHNSLNRVYTDNSIHGPQRKT